MYPVTLTGRAVTLREFRRDDAAAAFAVVGDQDITRWLSFDARDRAATRAMVDGIVDRAQVTLRAEYYLAVSCPATS
jgi:ribosomal-protein-alanine N-acetyltransferase